MEEELASSKRAMRSETAMGALRHGLGSRCDNGRNSDSLRWLGRQPTTSDDFSGFFFVRLSKMG